MRIKAGLINKISSTKGRLKEGFKTFSINFRQRKYYRFIRGDEK